MQWLPHTKQFQTLPLLTEHTDETQYNPSTKNACEIQPLLSPTKTSYKQIPQNKSSQL